MKEKKQHKRNISFLGYSPLIIIISIGLIIYFQFQPNNSVIEQISNAEDEKALSFFTSTGFNIQANTIQNNNGIAIIDYNFNSKKDIFVTGYDGTESAVWEFDDNTLKKISKGEFGKSNVIGIASCDIDSDGVEEIFLSTGDLSSDSKYLDQLFDYVDNQWIDIFDKSLGETNGRDVVCLDSDGDQIYELLQIDKNSNIRHISQKSDGGLELINANSGLEIKSTGDILLAIPLLSKTQDVLITNDSIGNTFFKNNGEGKYSIFDFNSEFSNKNNELRGLSYLDADSNQLIDLVYNNKYGDNKLLMQQSDSIFKDIFDTRGVGRADASSILAFDFDLNGLDDILMLTKDKNNEFLLALPDGYDPLPIGDLDDDLNITGAIVGFFNNNNQPDIILGHSNNMLSYYESFKTENNFLEVNALTKYNAPSRGATVKVYIEDAIITKIVDTGSGHYSQQDPTLVFGILDKQKVDKVEVIFPSGNTKTITDIDISKVVEIKDV